MRANDAAAATAPLTARQHDAGHARAAQGRITTTGRRGAIIDKGEANRGHTWATAQAIAGALALLLAGCGPTRAVDVAEQRAALHWALTTTTAAHPGTASARPAALWPSAMASGQLCGELRDAAGALVRFTFEPAAPTPTGAVDPATLPGGTGPGEEVLHLAAAQRFDGRWQAQCAPHRPWWRRGTAWSGYDIGAPSAELRTAAEISAEAAARDAAAEAIDRGLSNADTPSRP